MLLLLSIFCGSTWWKESWRRKILSQFFLEIISIEGKRKCTELLMGVFFFFNPYLPNAVGCLLCLLRLVNVGVPPSVSHKHLKANWDMKSHLHTSALTMVEIIPKNVSFWPNSFQFLVIDCRQFQRIFKEFYLRFWSKITKKWDFLGNFSPLC